MVLEKAPQQQAQQGNVWHVMSEGETLTRLGVHPERGLTAAEANSRLLEYGANELVEKGIKSPWSILREQLSNPLVLLLIFAAVVSGFLGKFDSVIAIGAIVILNAVLGVVQEYRAEQAMAALKKMAAPLVRVRRDGKVLDIQSREVVPGDIVLLEAGSIIPADSRVIEAANLRAQEASLTGESQPVDKTLGAIEDANAPLGDRHNMLYMGTSVTYGRGVAVVVETGMKTQLGRIAELIQTVEDEKTPLQRRMDELGRVLLIAAVVIVGDPIVPPPAEAGEEPQDGVLLNAVAIAVAVVPEGLPAVVTIALALGAQRMLRRNALIRKLPAVETLGSVTTICSDKTGTLTENRMTVKVIDVAGRTSSIDDINLDNINGAIKANGSTAPSPRPSQVILLAGSALASDAILEHADASGDYTITGDPTEGALVLAGTRANLMKPSLDKVFARVGEAPFDSDRKRMSTVHHVNSQLPMNEVESYLAKLLKTDVYPYLVFAKGAADGLLDVSNHVWTNGEIIPMTDEYRQRIEAKNNELAQDGLRVLGVAFRQMTELPTEVNADTLERDLVFVGMVGIIDPPRKEVKDAVAVSKQAGIRPVMITGDHPLTAFAIARELGIAKDGDRVLTGQDLSKMSHEELKAVVTEVPVYARVSPENKLNIVQALQERGEIAAMTGDGVNDAPALKRSNIGVAMGITGTAVSKEASDMVIVDDNFATIVSAVEEGRTIYDNVRRFVKYLLASNTGELFVLLMTQLIAGMTIPLTTLQILWMNLITDGIPALALGVEKAEKGGMNRPPYAPNESIFGRGLGRHILLVGLLLGLTGVGLAAWAFNNYNVEASAIVGITPEQFVQAKEFDLNLNDAPQVAAVAQLLGITSEQVIAAHSDVPTQNYHAHTWNTMVFMFLTIAQMGHALGLRSHRETFFSLPFFGNPLLLGAVVLTLALQLIAIYTPFFNSLFNTTPLSAEQLAICLALSSVVFIGVEFEKLLIRRGVFK
jgi:P-type Ca2+ transporter type 2C